MTTSAYLESELKATDAERYAAAGVLPYLTQLSDGTPGLWVLLGRRAQPASGTYIVGVALGLGGLALLTRDDERGRRGGSGR